MKPFKQLISEVSSTPVEIDWFYKKSGEWFGSFNVNDIEYDITFQREDMKHKLDISISSLKFSRPDLKDPYSFSKDFNKPLVVANTVKEALKQYLSLNDTDVFIIKSYVKEQSRVSKYRILTSTLMKTKFTFSEEIQYGNYIYFILFKNVSAYQDESVRKFIKSL